MQESLLIKLPVIIGDLFLLNLSWIFALTLFPQPAYVAHSLEIFACLNICFIPGLSWFGVILSSRIVPYEEIIRRVFYVVLCHIGFFTLIQTVWSYGLLPLRLTGVFYISLTVALMLWRYICRMAVKITRGHGRNSRRVIIVGSKDNALEVYHEMVDNSSTGYRVLGFFSNHDDKALPGNTPCLGSVDEALPWLKRHPVNEVYCCLSTDRYLEEIFPIMDYCENNFVRFYYVPNLRNYMKRAMNLELLGNVPILYIREEPLRQVSNRFVKRAFDVTVPGILHSGAQRRKRPHVRLHQVPVDARKRRGRPGAGDEERSAQDPFRQLPAQIEHRRASPVHQRAERRDVDRRSPSPHAPAHRALLQAGQ